VYKVQERQGDVVKIVMGIFGSKREDKLVFMRFVDGREGFRYDEVRKGG
jgi:hypothetical protein